MGIDFRIINEKSLHADNGEVAIIPPSLGLSSTLLNADHHEIYYANMPSMDDKMKWRLNLQCDKPDVPKAQRWNDGSEIDVPPAKLLQCRRSMGKKAWLC